jgi:hypothetical protein
MNASKTALPNACWPCTTIRIQTSSQNSVVMPAKAGIQ